MLQSTEVSRVIANDETEAVVHYIPSETQKNNRSQKLNAVLGATLAAATLVISANITEAHGPTKETPLVPNYENSTAVDITTWVGDLPPGTFERIEAEFTTGPTEEPTSWNPYGTTS